jgi:hypothetical protein
MLVEIHKDMMYFQVISRTGATVDMGGLPRQRPQMATSGQ